MLKLSFSLYFVDREDSFVNSKLFRGATKPESSSNNNNSPKCFIQRT